MLDKYSNDRDWQEQRGDIIFGAQAVADRLHGSSHRDNINDIGFNRGRSNRAGRQRLYGKTVQRTGARKTRAGNTIGSDLDGNGRMRLSVQPKSNFPDE